MPFTFIIDRDRPERDELIADFMKGGTIGVADLVRGDAEVPIVVRPVKKSRSGIRPYDDEYEDGDTIQLIIGREDEPPQSGTWGLSFNGNSTGLTTLDYDISASELQTAINVVMDAEGLPNVTITLIAVGIYRLDGTSFGAIPEATSTTNLRPASFVEVTRTSNGSVSTYAQQYIQLKQQPVALAEPSTELTAAAVTSSTAQSASSTTNKKIRISLTEGTYGGYFTLSATVSGSAFDCGLVSPLSSEAELGRALARHPAIRYNQNEGDNIEVTKEADAYLVEFTGNLSGPADPSITVANGSGSNALLAPLGLSGVLNLNTVNLATAFQETTATTLTFPISIRRTRGDEILTIFRSEISIYRSIIDYAAMVQLPGISVSTEWGGITGDIEDQTDLQAALATKADTAALESGPAIYLTARFTVNFLDGDATKHGLAILAGTSHDSMSYVGPVPCYTPSTPGYLRDPSIIFWRGTYFVAFTAGDYGQVPYFTIISSTNLTEWTTVANVTVNQGTKTWAPEFFADGNTLYIVVGANTSWPADSKLWLLTAQNDALTSWSAPVEITGFGVPVNDGCMRKIGSTYYLALYNGPATRNEMWTASSPTGPFSLQGALTSAPSDFEGPCMVQLTDGRWMLTGDDISSRGFTVYALSSDNMATWSTPARLGSMPVGLRHGTTIRLTGYDHFRVVSSARLSAPAIPFPPVIENWVTPSLILIDGSYQHARIALQDGMPEFLADFDPEAPELYKLKVGTAQESNYCDIDAYGGIKVYGAGGRYSYIEYDGVTTAQYKWTSHDSMTVIGQLWGYGGNTYFDYGGVLNVRAGINGTTFMQMLASGAIKFPGLQEGDPHVADQLFKVRDGDSGPYLLMISAG